MDRGTVALLFNTTKKILQSSCASKLSTAAHTAWGTKTPPSSPAANLTAVVQRRSKSLRGGFAPHVRTSKTVRRTKFPCSLGGDILNYKVLKSSTKGRGGQLRLKVST